ncbi:hypothetical protein [Thiothrix nivea]|uniref:Uncharacterized protein n=1 Tax=Thiothrix nivea (strain ATCC 35100 / DSM 5205 / JP2) TaxID=870187 RepID=A0A656HFD9_THINJ|nr:hypothetical protein [Thiothrix nivea]EIJ34714.1 hypothetical protein Thini_2147 [Thiothrix nivea DSM 5205]
MDMTSEKAPTQKVAYWPSGLWCDPETAALAAELGEFPADYQIAEFPADADPALIDKEVLQLVEGK